MNEFPKNCNSCKYAELCNHHYYGSRGCEFEREIAKAILEEETKIKHTQ